VANIWTKAAIEFVTQQADILKDEEIAAALTRLTGITYSVHAVRKKRFRLGIEKTRGRGNRVRRPAPPPD